MPQESHPALIIGMGQGSVYQPEEWIDLADFEWAYDLVVEMATLDRPA